MIRRSLKWIMPALLLMCVAMSAQEAQAGGAFVTGNKLVKWMQANEECDKNEKDCPYFDSGMFIGYVTGVMDATHWMHSIPTGVMAGQLYAIVSKFLKEHPERWSEPGDSIVIDALKKAFPKR
jgi:hypothetical protein